MIVNRDKWIWVVVVGGDLKVDDSNILDLLEVKTNEFGLLEGDGYFFFGGVEVIDKMKVVEGMEINLFVFEE